MAGDVDLPDGLEGQYDALLGGVLGHVASSEGWPALLFRMGKKYGDQLSRLVEVVPRHFGTAVVPVTLQTAAGLRIHVVSPKLCLLDKFPFGLAQIPSVDGSVTGCARQGHCPLPDSRHRLLEFYAAKDIIGFGVQGIQPPESRTEAVWRPQGLKESFVMDGLATYIVYGDADVSVNHNNFSLNSRTASNWYNVFLPLKRGIRCEDGYTISLISVCRVYESYPSYRLELIIEDSSGQLVYCQTFEFDYRDVEPNLVQYKVLKKDWEKAR